MYELDIIALPHVTKNISFGYRRVSRLKIRTHQDAVKP